MILNRNKLYSILFIACLTGYIWLYFSAQKTTLSGKKFGVCLIKQVTNIPCPSCGTTRSVTSLAKGDFFGALYMNPLGYLVALIMILAPFWMISDIITKKDSLFDFYKKVEFYLKKPKYAVPLILLVIINWIWNISKGL